MKIKKNLLPVAAGLFIALAVSLLTLNWYKKAQQNLVLAQNLLRDYRIEEAKTRFARLESSIWLSKQARLGSIITAALTESGTENLSLPDVDNLYIEDYHLPELLQKELTDSDFDRCIRLAKIGRFYRFETANLYYAAALLETGHTAEALKTFSMLPSHLKNTPLGSNMADTFDLLSKGAQKIVRDRNGQLIGTVSANHEFIFYRERYRSLIQPEIIRDLIDNEFAKGMRLSIDLELSSLARLALGHNRGSIVLVKPDTGEILAAVNDKHTAKKMGDGSSPAFEQMLEPASISKLITITAALRYKLDVDREVGDMTCRGYKWYSGKVLNCPAPRGKLFSLDHALATSCNTAFADLAVKLGWEKMLQELRLYGFDSSTSNPFPLGRIIINQGDDRNLADLGIGLEDTVISPVHAALIAAVFANDGTWVYPQLFHATDGLMGISPQKINKLKCARILFEEWLPTLHDAMWAVTRAGGTAAFVAPIGFPVYMKTGTGGNYRDGFHVNYIGYAPEHTDKIAFCVRVTDKRTSGRARKAGYNATHQLLLSLGYIASGPAARGT